MDEIHTTIRVIFAELTFLLEEWQEKNGGRAHFTLQNCGEKVQEEYLEWGESDYDASETADIIISSMNYMIASSGSLFPLVERLQEVLARTDQQERDKARGIG